jgi:hypothetical protein
VIKMGDKVRIKKEFQDPGDDQFSHIALEDEDGGRVRIVTLGTRMVFPPNHIIETRMLERDE